MSDDGGRIRATRAAEVAFICDPDRTNPRWYWSPGVAYVLDVDWRRETNSDDWRRQAREAGESWVTRSSEAVRAILMRARRQKHPLIRTNVYVTQASRIHGLIEQPLRVLAVIEAGDWYVWTDPEDLQLQAVKRQSA